MKSILQVAVAMFVSVGMAAAAQAAAVRSGAAAVVVVDDGAVGAPAAKELQRLATEALQRKGVEAAVEGRLAPHALDGEAEQILEEVGAGRVFALRIGGALGLKVRLELSEVGAKGFAVQFQAALVAEGLEEADKIVPRLVAAVVERQGPREAASVSTVTGVEAAPYLKKPGERFWILGFAFGATGARTGSYGKPAGIFVGYGYEAEDFRVDLRLQGEGHGNGGSSFFGIAGTWLPMAGNFSPYATLGLGYGSITAGGALETQTASGVTATVEAGVEMFRLHGTRLLAGLHLVVPLYSVHGMDLSSPVAPGVHLRVAF